MSDRPYNAWTEEEEAVARRMWKEGSSHSEIGRHFGITRNASAGRIWRLGLRRDSTETSGQASRIEQKRQSRRRSYNKRNKRVSHWFARPKKIKPREIDMLEPISLSVSLMGLTDSACKWPHGDGPYVFCGHRAASEGPYCEYHSQVAYQPPEARRARYRQSKKALESA